MESDLAECRSEDIDRRTKINQNKYDPKGQDAKSADFMKKSVNACIGTDMTSQEGRQKKQADYNFGWQKIKTLSLCSFAESYECNMLDA